MLRTRMIMAAAILLGIARPALRAQTEKTTPPDKSAPVVQPAPAAQTTPPPYLLAAEDVISIAIINFPSFSTQVVVPPDGTIIVPPLKEPFSVAGKTTQEVAQILTEKLARYIKGYSVTVSLTQKRKQENILFYGFVTRVGVVEYRPNLRLIPALAEVGGALLNGDLSHVTLTRATGEKRALDLSHPETKGGSEVDFPLERGDVIYVPERRTQFMVVGEVSRPGSFDYKEEMTVLDALTAVGGPRMETADLAAATLIHDGKEQKLDLDALLRRGDLSGNIKLVAGDRIMVPEIRNRTYIFGAVQRPGFYIFKPGDRILDALNGSGGPYPEANLAKVNHIRIDRTKNTAAVDVIDVEKFLKKGDLKANIALEPGDILYIPMKKKAFNIQDVFSVLSGLNLVNSTVSIFTRGFGSGYRY